MLIQLHSEVAPLKSVSGVFPGSNSPYDNLSANSIWAFYVDLVSLCFNALLAAAEIWQATFLPQLWVVGPWEALPSALTNKVRNVLPFSMPVSRRGQSQQYQSGIFDWHSVIFNKQVKEASVVFSL